MNRRLVPTHVVALGNMPVLAQRAISERLKPVGLANYPSAPTGVLPHLNGFCFSAILTAHVKVAQAILLCAPESDEANTRHIAEVLAQRSKMEVRVSLWNGSMRINEETIDLSGEASARHACVGCIDCRCTGGIHHIAFELITEPVAIFRLPGSALSGLAQSGHSEVAVRDERAFLDHECSVIRKAFPRTTVSTHEGCMTYTRGPRKSVPLISSIWGSVAGRYYIRYGNKVEKYVA